MSLVDPSTPIPDAAQLGHVHLIGVGGVSMSGLATMMRARGLPVSGSDARDSRELTALGALGVRTTVGHEAAAVADADTVVVSSAIAADNPELLAARERGIPVLPRVVALVALTRGRRVATVAGTHGKTTTTSMLTVALQAAGADPSFAIGGQLADTGAGAHEGTGEAFVAEADESDGSFLLFAPEVAVVTNVESDHLENWGTEAAYADGFAAYAGTVRSGGALVVGVDDPGGAQLADRARAVFGAGRRVVGVGTGPDADVRIGSVTLAGMGSRCTLTGPGWSVLMRLRVPGRHNVVDAALALTAAVALGVSPQVAAAGLGGFRGARRRFEPRGTAAGVRVVDDYSHLPTEVSAALASARQVVGGGRVIVVFQPHLYSRTVTYAEEFGRALAAADEVVVMDVYAARESPRPGVSGRLVADAVPLPADRVVFEHRWVAVPPLVAARARPGDLVLTVGAGDVTLIGPEVLALLAARVGTAS
jgi:UDP-N-acetylmuramate--alanine ligase